MTALHRYSLLMAAALLAALLGGCASTQIRASRSAALDPGSWRNAVIEVVSARTTGEIQKARG